MNSFLCIKKALLRLLVVERLDYTYTIVFFSGSCKCKKYTANKPSKPGFCQLRMRAVHSWNSFTIPDNSSIADSPMNCNKKMHPAEARMHLSINHVSHPLTVAKSYSTISAIILAGIRLFCRRSAISFAWDFLSSSSKKWTSSICESEFSMQIL